MTVFAADYPFLDVLWTMVIFFCWVVWIWMMILILSDVFRRGQNTDSKYWVQYNVGKGSLAIDLKHPEGVGIIKDLVPHFDVVMETRLNRWKQTPR